MPVVPTIHNWGEAVLVSLTTALLTFLSFIPALIGAIIILVIGWILSGILARLVEKVLTRVGFEVAAERAGVTGFLASTGAGKLTASHVIAELVKWFIRLIFLEVAAQALHLAAVTTLLNAIVLWIPNLVVALLILMVGMLVARFVAGLVRGAVAQSGMANPRLIASLAEWGIIALAVIMALNQVGIAASLVTILFMGVVGALALALGLAFGLGGRETAGQFWRQWAGVPSSAVGGDGGSPRGGNGGGMATREEHRDAEGWRTAAVSKLHEARQAVARGEADPSLSAELDDIIARVEHRSRQDTSHHASI
jgi:mechanosensitive ion channel-like protein